MGKSLCPTIEKAELLRSCDLHRRAENRKPRNRTYKMIPAGRFSRSSS
nr:MAG TPA: hypothetical protein [Caudoviricetes sp.]